VGWSRAADPQAGQRWYVGCAVKKVLLFTMEGNADGEAALTFFQSRGAAVDVRDVGRDPEASAEVFRLAGRLAVPTIVIDERVFLGFGGHREEMEALVRE
jgi:glutaredoxin